MMAEIWKVVPGYDGHYEASTYGRIRSLWFKNGTVDRARSEPHYLKFYTREGHYPTVTFRRGQNAICVHKVILETFVGPRPSGHCCGHADGDKSNNALENISWITFSQNNGEDKRRLGQSLTGAKNHQAKLSDEAVVELRMLWETGHYTAKSLGFLFGVSHATAWRIAVRKNWAHVA